MDDNCVEFVPLSAYDFSGLVPGWLPWNPTVYCLVASVAAVTYCLSIELLATLFATFKRRTGVYFWSIILATGGIILYNTANILISFENRCPEAVVNVFLNLGWGAMITGFSLVLWSRLHLVINKSRLLKYILAVIIFNGVVWNSIAIGVSFGLTLKYRKEFGVVKILNIIEGVVFQLQETTLSILYMYCTLRFLRGGYSMRTRRVFGFLLSVQVLAIALDSILWALVFTDRLTLGNALHPLTQCLKLRLEFTVLNQLQQLATSGFACSPDFGVPSEGANRESMLQIPQSPTRGSSNERLDFITTADHSTILVSHHPSAPDFSMPHSPQNQDPEKSTGIHNHDDIVPCRESRTENASNNGIIAQDSIDDLEAMYLGRWAVAKNISTSI